MSLLPVERPDYLSEPEFEIFEQTVSRFFDEHASPKIVSGWRDAGAVPRAAWRAAGATGLLCTTIPEEYGGGGGDFRHDAIIARQVGLRNLEGWCLAVHSGVVAPYIFHYGSEEQKKKWLPRLGSGEWVGAIAMTEPGAGSDLQAIKTTARREGDVIVLNGQKVFISNGQTADLIIVAAKTDPNAGAKGISLIVVETAGLEGFRRGRNLEKIGLEQADTSELFFDNVVVPASNLLGTGEGGGFYQLMAQLPQERLFVAILCQGLIERALELTVDYAKNRQAFGSNLIDFQNTQFRLAECKTEATISRVFVDHCCEQHLKGKLDSAKAAMAKLHLSELSNKIVDICLQFFGGYGYMAEYPIAQLYKDVRVRRILGGSSEIMKILIARTL